MSFKIKCYFNLYAKYISSEKGYGVFTDDFIPEGALVETCYVIPSTGQEWKDYLFGNVEFLPLGFGCIYNHSYDSNIRWQGTDQPFTINFYSTKDITPDSELCHNYGKHYWNARMDKKLL